MDIQGLLKDYSKVETLEELDAELTIISNNLIEISENREHEDVKCWLSMLENCVQRIRKRYSELEKEKKQLYIGKIRSKNKE